MGDSNYDEKLEALVEALRASSIPKPPFGVPIQVDKYQGLVESMLLPEVAKALAAPLQKTTLYMPDTGPKTIAAYPGKRIKVDDLIPTLRDLAHRLAYIHQTWGLYGNLSHVGSVMMVDGTLGVFVFPHVLMEHNQEITVYLKSVGWLETGLANGA